MHIVALTPPGGPEWIIILVVVVLLFGARKLPELGSSVGKSIKNFKKGLEEGHDTADHDTADQDEVQADAQDEPTDESRAGGEGRAAGEHDQSRSRSEGSS